MNRYRLYLMLILTCSACTVRAGRPLVIDDADPADQGMFEFETGISYDKDGDTEHWHVPVVLTYGVLANLEVGIESGGRIAKEGSSQEEDFSDLFIGAKWRFLQEKKWIPRMAIAPVVKIPTSSEEAGTSDGKIDSDLSLIASKQLGESVGMHVLAGYGWTAPLEKEDENDVLHYGLALDWQFLETVQWVGEIFAERELESDTNTAVLYNSGFRWSPIENLTIDFAAGSRLSDDGPDLIATAGLTWAIGSGKNN
jgi:hypothetical protein